MKTITVRPILVESKEPTDLFIGKTYRVLHYNNPTPEEIFKHYQQLILISLEDEKIEIGDLFYSIYRKRVSRATRIEEDGTVIFDDVLCENSFPPSSNSTTIKKVIATQDQLSPELIQQLLDEYNSEGMKDFEIEMDLIQTIKKGVGKYDHPERYKWEPKLTNGFVTVVKKEPILYTEEEVESLCNQSYNYGFKGGLYEHSGVQSKEHNCNSFNDWFEQNKKK